MTDEREPTAFQVRMSCHHTASFNPPVPMVGHMIYCSRCAVSRVVVDTFGVWGIRCRDCRYARRFGNARITAGLSASRHSRRRPGHRVELLHHGEVLETLLVTMDTFDDLPPF